MLTVWQEVVMNRIDKGFGKYQKYMGDIEKRYSKHKEMFKRMSHSDQIGELYRAIMGLHRTVELQTEAIDKLIEKTNHL